MSDLVSRQDVKDWLKRWRGYLDDDMIARMQIGTKDIKPVQQWTPCSVRFPEAGVRYQVTFESGEVGYADFRNKIFLSDGSVKENVWEIERYYEDDGEVIAWMPLPEPYKKKENKE